MMMTRFGALALLASLSLSGTVLAADINSDKRIGKTMSVGSKNPWDYDIHSGAAFGTFTNKDGVTKEFGGVIAGFTLFDDNLFDNQSAFVFVDMLIDAGNQQVIRKGGGVGLSYPLVGAKKRVIDRLKAGTVVSQTDFSLNWVNRLAYAGFSATPAAIGIDALEGSNVALYTGLGLDWLLGRQGSLNITAQLTLASFATSIENSTQSSTELLFGWRSYL